MSFAQVQAIWENIDLNERDVYVSVIQKGDYINFSTKLTDLIPISVKENNLDPHDNIIFTAIIQPSLDSKDSCTTLSLLFNGNARYSIKDAVNIFLETHQFGILTIYSARVTTSKTIAEILKLSVTAKPVNYVIQIGSRAKNICAMRYKKREFLSEMFIKHGVGSALWFQHSYPHQWVASISGLELNHSQTIVNDAEWMHTLLKIKPEYTASQDVPAWALPLDKMSFIRACLRYKTLFYDPCSRLTTASIIATAMGFIHREMGIIESDAEVTYHVIQRSFWGEYIGYANILNNTFFLSLNPACLIYCMKTASPSINLIFANFSVALIENNFLDKADNLIASATNVLIEWLRHETDNPQDINSGYVVSNPRLLQFHGTGSSPRSVRPCPQLFRFLIEKKQHSEESERLIALFIFITITTSISRREIFRCSKMILSLGTYGPQIIFRVCAHLKISNVCYGTYISNFLLSNIEREEFSQSILWSGIQATINSHDTIKKVTSHFSNFRKWKAFGIKCKRASMCGGCEKLWTISYKNLHEKMNFRTIKDCTEDAGPKGLLVRNVPRNSYIITSSCDRSNLNAMYVPRPPTEELGCYVFRFHRHSSLRQDEPEDIGCIDVVLLHYKYILQISKLYRSNDVIASTFCRGLTKPSTLASFISYCIFHENRLESHMPISKEIQFGLYVIKTFSVPGDFDVYGRVVSTIMTTMCLHFPDIFFESNNEAIEQNDLNTIKHVLKIDSGPFNLPEHIVNQWELFSHMRTLFHSATSVFKYPWCQANVPYEFRKMLKFITKGTETEIPRLHHFLPQKQMLTRSLNVNYFNHPLILKTTILCKQVCTFLIVRLKRLRIIIDPELLLYIGEFIIAQKLSFISEKHGGWSDTDQLLFLRQAIRSRVFL